ncbi:MAG TPA: dihydroorotate dehydrogenase-like protein, partial [bacterium]|nr:dihydroorotate dehydrogenase-like protein [bacterium]
PVVPSASPLSKHVDNIRKMEDAGASAVVLFSLFEEQIYHDFMQLVQENKKTSNDYLHSFNYLSELNQSHYNPDAYLEHIRKSKEAVDIPIIASLNGSSDNGWLQYAKSIEVAGADGIELNLYHIAADPKKSSAQIEDQFIHVVRSVKNLKIPVSVKLSTHITGISHFISRLDEIRIDGIALFNRFYQPDFNLNSLKVVPNINLSDSTDLRPALRWTAILYGQIQTPIAATGGIHSHEDVIKMIMAGASVTMVCSALLKNGIGHIADLLRDIEMWMEIQKCDSLNHIRGSMSQKSHDDPSAIERAQYIKALAQY